VTAEERARLLSFELADVIESDLIKVMARYDNETTARDGNHWVLRALIYRLRRFIAPTFIVCKKSAKD